MYRIDSEILIGAPPAAVWRVITDLDRYPAWNRFTPRITLATRDLAVGAELDLDCQMTPRKLLRDEHEVILALEPERFALCMGTSRTRGRPGIVSYRWQICEGASAGRTRFLNHEEFQGPLAPLVHTHEIVNGPVMADGKVRVRCARVDHYHAVDYAYRFDTPDRSFVFSGDTRRSDALIDLARGADVLVHEAMLESALRTITDGNAPRLMDHLLRSHSTTEEVGRVAEAAGVGTLVLSHLVPAGPNLTDEMWIEGVRRHYRGRIIVGRDGMEI